ncbi:MAG: hypothetical protein ACLR2E_12100 [Lachnospiraceae bacterium]
MLTFMKLCCLVIMEAFAAVIFLEGILQWKQKEPVRFWSEEQAAEENAVKNVEIYNRIHGSLWMILGGVSMISLIVNYLTGAAHTGFTVLCGIVVMFVIHQITGKYYGGPDGPPLSFLFAFFIWIPCCFRNSSIVAMPGPDTGRIHFPE